MSRPRSAGSKARRALLARLLRHGQRFEDPGADILEAAAELQDLGLVQVQQSKAVLCANPDDQDFPPPDPDCSGLIELRQGADEGGGDYACPCCGHVVYPIADAKEQIALLTVTLDQEGIERFIRERCSDVVEGQGFTAGGVLVVPGLPQNRFICLVDFCTDPMFLTPAWIESQPCIYIIADPRAWVRLGTTTGGQRVELVDLVCGSVALDMLAHHDGALSRQSRPARAVLVTECTTLALPSTDQGPTGNSPGQFTVSVSHTGIQVNDIVVEDDSSSFAYRSFIELMRQFASDLLLRVEVAPLTPDEIADRLEKQTDDEIDSGSVRRAINRLDKTIVEQLRKAGCIIKPGDVIENVTRAGKYSGRYGFRLNPDKVRLGTPPPTAT